LRHCCARPFSLDRKGAGAGRNVAKGYPREAVRGRSAHKKNVRGEIEIGGHRARTLSWRDAKATYRQTAIRGKRVEGSKKGKKFARQDGGATILGKERRQGLIEKDSEKSQQSASEGQKSVGRSGEGAERRISRNRKGSETCGKKTPQRPREAKMTKKWGG